jgi:hypothetical protein
VLGVNEISDIVPLPSYGPDAEGRGVPGYKISFMLRGHGPYMVFVPSAGFTSQKALMFVRLEAERMADVMDGKP